MADETQFYTAKTGQETALPPPPPPPAISEAEVTPQVPTIVVTASPSEQQKPGTPTADANTTPPKRANVLSNIFQQPGPDETPRADPSTPAPPLGAPSAPPLANTPPLTPASIAHAQIGDDGDNDAAPTNELYYEKKAPFLSQYMLQEQRQRTANQSDDDGGGFGTVMGVFIPCVQNILGVILFLRLPWICAQASIGGAVGIVLLSAAATFLTSLSMSAIATNGIVPAGGAYYMISRALGPEFGGAVGILFYLGTTVAAAMYVLGAIETAKDSISDLTLVDGWDFQIQGAILLLLMVCLVFVGVKYVNKVGLLFLFAVFIAVLSIFIGVFTYSKKTDDPETTVPKGVQSSIFNENTKSEYTDGYSFQGLLAIFFPSVTGIMAGSNRSGQLKNPGRSIPKGTIAAIILTTIIYVIDIILFGASIPKAVLQDDLLVSATVGFPVHYVVRVGIFLSSVGAGLQSLVGAPQLLQAIAKDNIIPPLRFFREPEAPQPRRALALTFFIALLAVMGGDVNVVAPLVSMFFLMNYGFVNLACFLLSVLRAPNFRPRWRWYAWWTALIGCLWCTALMFIISWLYCLIAFAIAGGIYKYIEFKRVEANWGDGLRGLAYQRALTSLYDLDPNSDAHTKNWRPQVLCLAKMDPSGEQCEDTGALAFLHQLKKGKGLTIVGNVHVGVLADIAPESAQRRSNLYRQMLENNISGFADVSVSTNLTNGLHYMIQSTGLGALRPNTIMFSWPTSWKDTPGYAQMFRDIISDCKDLSKAVIVLKDERIFPKSREKQHGFLDVWWIVHDGGMMILLAFLLQKHKVWRNTTLRIFTVARETENSIQLESDIRTLVYNLRIEADIQVFELESGDISPYTYERTLRMEERRELLSQMKQERRRAASIEEADDITAHYGSMLSVPNMGAGSGMTLGGSGAGEREGVCAMDTAVKLNQMIVQRSKDASLVLLNLPPPPLASAEFPSDYMEYVDALTENIPRAALIRGCGREVVTAYS